MLGGMESYDFEGLEAFRVALEVAVLGDEAFARLRSVRPHLAHQIGRCSLSAMLNTAEATGRRTPADQAHFYSIARGSGAETAAAFLFCERRRLLPSEMTSRARELLLPLLKMQSRLARPRPPSTGPRP